MVMDMICDICKQEGAFSQCGVSGVRYCRPECYARFKKENKARLIEELKAMHGEAKDEAEMAAIMSKIETVNSW